VIAGVLAHHARRTQVPSPPQTNPERAMPYRPESLSVLFGQEPG